MRKDVKLGFTIGGVLLAVLIVYVLVISSGPSRKNEVSLAKPELSPVPDAAAQPGPATQSPAANDSGKAPDQAGNAAALDPFKPELSDSAARAAKDRNGAPAGASQDKWALALQTGKVPLLMTETPAPQDKSGAAGVTPGASPVNGTPPGSDSAGGTLLSGATVASTARPEPANVAPSAGANSNDTLAGQILGSMPATQPSASALPSGGAKRTHVVQQGESFATIAAAAYGNSAYYPHLLRANPNLDPKKLRPGMTIVIPDPGEVVAHHSNSGTPAETSADTSGTAASVGTASFDQKTQYRVQPNDSLYRISVRLYGKADRVDKLYEMNKDQIGANPAHLKVGMILKLPDPPVSSASAR